MTLNLEAVGRKIDGIRNSWTADDALLYAVSVGAGQDDPLEELQFTTENSTGVEQQVLPTYGVILNEFKTEVDFGIGVEDLSKLVHAEQTITLHRPLPTSGTLEVSAELIGIYDKGSGALVESEYSGRIAGETEPSVVTRSSLFISGEGGFGGRGPASEWEAPEGDPDLRIPAQTLPSQALLYRLTGDRNPLHSDPNFAAQGGFDRPILHGMCTYGIAGRALLGALADGRPDRFESMTGRFTHPVIPGNRLEVEAWTDGPVARFRVLGPGGTVVLDRGRFTVRDA